MRHNKRYQRADYWLKGYWPVREELKDVDIQLLKTMRTEKETICAHPPSRHALTAALLDLAWIRIALNARQYGRNVNRVGIGYRCPIRIG